MELKVVTDTAPDPLLYPQGWKDPIAIHLVDGVKLPSSPVYIRLLRLLHLESNFGVIRDLGHVIPEHLDRLISYYNEVNR